MFIVMVTAAEGAEPEPVGPFPNLRWAKRYIERVTGRYFRLDIRHLIAPILIGLKDPNDKDSELEHIFDPAEGIDK